MKDLEYDYYKVETEKETFFFDYYENALATYSKERGLARLLGMNKDTEDVLFER